ncbi:MAG TPA: TetR/AcrR family transcriptional regulator [Solirubrobacteraceae bacterium]|nr:TetR/AcrR family transcriptional regulator [Solirubrobacteraceae bacterium]
MIEPVRDGVFFHIPDSLPRGRHDLARKEVIAAQRERLMIALTELMAAKGYAAVTVGAVADRAKISRASFYKCFSDQEACAFAAYDRFIEVLLADLQAAGGGDDWDEIFGSLIRAYLAALQRDLVVARAFQVEMDAVGARARAHRREALVRFAHYIRAERERVWTGPGAPAALPLSAFVGLVYAARQLACDALDAEQEPDLLALAPDLTTWMSMVLRSNHAAGERTVARSRARP